MTNAAMTWDEAEQDAKRQGGGKYVKLEPGQAIELVFAGEQVRIRRTVWTGSGSEDYDPTQHDEKDAKKRYTMDVYVPAEDAWKTFEMSAGVFMNLGAARNEYRKDFAQRLVKVKREGAGKDTKYMFFVKDVVTVPGTAPTADTPF